MHAAEIAEARARGRRPVILDTYQSAGIVPLDVTALDIDFAVGGCLKWLCGGPGNAFLYTRPELRRRLRPTFTGWVSHRNPFAFDTTRRRDVRADAMGMMNGTPSIPAYYAALAGLDIISEVGLGAFARAREVTAGCSRCGRSRLPSAATRGSGAAGRHRRHQRPGAAQVARTLKARDFLVDYRPPVGVRSRRTSTTQRTRSSGYEEMASIVEKKDYETTPARSLVT